MKKSSIKTILTSGASYVSLVTLLNYTTVSSLGTVTIDEIQESMKEDKPKTLKNILGKILD